MSLSSLFRKNKQETPDDDQSHFRANDEPNPKRPRARRKAAADDQAADPVLPEKKRARRRLIGAVALVLAAVIGLPMVLDSEPRPVAQDIDIKIPSKSHATESRRLPQAAALDPAEQILEPVENAPVPHAAATPAKPAAVATVSEASAASVQQGKPVNADKVVAQAPKAQAADIPVAKNDAKSAVKPDSHAKDAKAEAKPAAASERETERAMAILEGKVAPKSEAAKTAADGKPGRYSIQVAALSSQNKVNELRSKLKAAGIASQTQKVPVANGERIRVRVGPFASKEEAEKMRARLVKLGLNGSLVPLGE